MGVTMAENVEQATRPQLAELVQLLVERVQTKARTVEPGSIEWAPPRPPVLRACCVAMAPPDGPGGAPPTIVVDGLDALIAALDAA